MAGHENLQIYALTLPVLHIAIRSRSNDRNWRIHLHFRKQNQLEDAIIALGDALRSRYILSYRPDRNDSGLHKIVVGVDRPGAVVYARPGYRIADGYP